MKFPQNDKEFKEYLKNQIVTIENMKLSQDKKDNLYELVHETSKRYYELKGLNASENLKKLGENLENLVGQGKIINKQMKIISKGVEYLYKIHKKSKNDLIKDNLGKN